MKPRRWLRKLARLSGGDMPGHRSLLLTAVRWAVVGATLLLSGVGVAISPILFILVVAIGVVMLFSIFLSPLGILFL